MSWKWNHYRVVGGFTLRLAESFKTLGLIADHASQFLRLAARARTASDNLGCRQLGFLALVPCNTML